MYSHNQHIILRHTEEKVKTLFKNNPAPAHEFDHSERVRAWIVQIAKAEKADLFLCEFAALVHDIGRTIEKSHPGVRHHELSYTMLREWFRTDSVFDDLSRSEKIIILYSVRYHWNNAADKYDEAIILRDADKLDMLGKVGVKRSIVFSPPEELSSDFRFKYDAFYWLQTDKAKALAKKYKLMEPVDREYLKYLKKFVGSVSL